MRKLTIGLLVLVAASLLATSLVVAHDAGTGENASELSGTEQAEWMEEHAANMRERMGMSYEEMDEMMDDGHADGMTDGMGCH